MTEFSTAAEVIFEPNDSSIRKLRERVENIGPIPVEYEPVASNPAARSVGRTDGSTALGGGRNTESILKDIREINESTLIQLEDMADTFGGRDGGGGGGVTDLFAGIIGDFGGEAAGAVAETVSSTTGVTAGTTAGSATGSFLGTFAGEVLAGGGGGPLGTLIDEVLGDGGSGSSGGGTATVELADGETPLPVEDVEPLDVENPAPLGVIDPSPLAVEDAGPIPVDAPESIPIDVNADVSSRSTTTSISRTPHGDDRGASGGVRPTNPAVDGSDPGFFESVGTGVAAGVTTGGTIGLAGGPQTAAVGAVGGGVLGGAAGVLGFGLNQADDYFAGGGGFPSHQGQRGGTDVDISMRRNTTVTVEPRSLDTLKREIIEEVEQAHEKDIRELERELDKLERALRGGP